MKRKHEQWFLDARNRIWASIEDHTDRDEVSLPEKLLRFYKNSCIDQKHRKGVRSAIKKLARILKKVPTPSLEMLYHSVRRSSESPYTSGMHVIVEELAHWPNPATESCSSVVIP